VTDDRPRTRPRGPFAHEGAGVTLLELVLVLLVISVVVGGALGMFAALDLDRRQTSGLVKNVLRSAQNTAIASEAPARVRIDAQAGRLWAEALAVVGTWHFEDRRMAGAFELDGAADPELFVEDGYIGDALSFGGRLGTVAQVPVQHDPAFDFEDGFSVACAIRWEDAGGGRLLSIGSTCALELGGAGQLRGRFTAAAAGAAPGAGAGRGRVRAGPRVTVQSEPGVVAPERWTRVRLAYDRRELVLEVDGAVVASVPETAPVMGVDGPLVLSDERRPFPGSVDALVVSAVVAQEPAALGDTVRLVEAPDVVYFAAGGGLDRRLHREPVRIVIAHEDGTRETIGVGFYGTVEG